MTIAAFRNLDPETKHLLESAALRWRDSHERPQVDLRVLDYWDRLVAEWLSSPMMPLFVRKSARAGEVVAHQSGRTVVCVDNSPAHWCFACALDGQTPSPSDVRLWLEQGKFPIGMVLKAKSQYIGTLSRMNMPDLNKLGWKVCHIESVGLNDKSAINQLPLTSVISHTRRLLSPRNMFLVPLRYQGLGEVPEFIQVFRPQS